jgi:hypothetical protein
VLTIGEVVLKQETEAIEVDSDIEDIAAPAPQSKTITMAPKTSIQVTRPRKYSPPLSEAQHNIPMVFLLPRTDTLIEIARLPTDVQTELRHRFHETCNSSEKRKERYRAMKNRPQNRLNKEECIRCQFIETGKGSKRPDGYYTKGGEIRRSADNPFIEKRSPCLHMVWHTEVPTLCIVCRCRQGCVSERSGTSWSIGWNWESS